MSKFKVSITVPKAMGKSSKITLSEPDTVINIVKKNNEISLLDRIISNEVEFNRFVLVYLDGKRVKDANTLINNDSSEIEIIVPMAGG